MPQRSSQAAATRPADDSADRRGSSVAAISDRLREWKAKTVSRALRRLGLHEDDVSLRPPPTPLDLQGHDFLRDVGLPGEYPFTSWLYPIRAVSRGGEDARPHRAGRYSGYGTAEDCRDYYREMQQQGFRLGGPNLASDLPSQLGWDSDAPAARGEVGRVGVAIDSLRDFETLYEAFSGDSGIHHVASNWTINAPAIVYVGFYCALAQKLGVPLDRLRCTPQNDILKEYVGRGLYIFPVQPAMRLVRDLIVFMHEHMPLSNSISICAEHMRYAGATTPQSFAFAFANAKAYIQLGLDAGLDIDSFVKRFTFRGFGDSTLGFLVGVAAPRAARRMWARIMREQFGAKDDRTCLLRGGEHAWGNAYMKLSAQRPLNNIVRGTLEATIQGLSSGEIGPGVYPFDEPLGLGHSLEAQQIHRDMVRILQHEAKLGDVIDPFAGSYAVEALTDKIEQETQTELDKVERLGGAVPAVETGYYRRVVATSAWDAQRRLETGEEIWVGVNKFVGPDEIEVLVDRTSEYDLKRLEGAEERQLLRLADVRRTRSSREVKRALYALELCARDETVNLVPPIIECAIAYATIGEICDVLRTRFGEARYA